MRPVRDVQVAQLAEVLFHRLGVERVQLVAYVVVHAWAVRLVQVLERDPLVEEVAVE